MSRRVYEIARELDLDTKEVIGRLNEAGVEVKHHSASVEDPVYERVFGDGAGDGAGGDQKENDRSEAQEAEAREARVEAERSGHGANIAAAPAAEPVAAPKEGAKKERKRRRVVIDASATSRSARPAVAHATPPKEPERAATEEMPEETGVMRVEPGATVKDLGEALGVPPTQIIKVLMSLGEMKTLTQTLSTEEIELVAEELEVEIEIGAVEEPALEEVAPEDRPEDLVEKPPVASVVKMWLMGSRSLRSLR